MNLERSVKTLVGFAFATFLSLGAVTTACASGTGAAVAATEPPAGIEVIVVTAKRPPAEPSKVDEPIYEVVVTAKRAVHQNTNRTPPVMAIEMPRLELAVADSVIRL
jgi:outer membrane cobalamin receptor